MSLGQNVLMEKSTYGKKETMGKFESIFRDLRAKAEETGKSRGSSGPMSFTEEIYSTSWRPSEWALESAVASEKQSSIKVFKESEGKHNSHDIETSSASSALVLEETSSEKKEVVKALENYVLKETEKLEVNTLEFPGGEIESKHPHKVVELGESDQVLEKKIKILFLSDRIQENDQVLKNDSQELFDKIVKAMNLNADDYQLLSLLNLEESDSAAEKNLRDMVAKYEPEVLLSMGATATRLTLGRKDRLTKVRGNLFNRRISRLGASIDFKIMPIFHPDFLLINPKMKSTTWNDLQLVLKEI